MGTDKELAESVNLLKKKRNAIILAHVYQPAEVQDIADYVGDSLDLSRKAVKTNADVIFLRCAIYGRNRRYPQSPQNGAASRQICRMWVGRHGNSTANCRN